MKNIKEIRSDFPILNKEVYGKPLVYFDNGATTQKPQSVIDSVNEVLTSYNSNIHRGVHYLSDMSSEAYENARQKVASFINAGKKEEVIFTSGTTGSINTIAFSYGERYIKPGDEIIISYLEHHANIVPWQMLCERKGAVLKVIPMNENGGIIIEEYHKLLSSRTKLVSVTQVSNSLGTILPVSEIIRAAHSMNIPVLVDGAQGIQHGIVDVGAMDCDFYTFSGHKVYGPTGIGILYGKEKWLSELPPYQGGGDMVDKVTFEKTTYNQLPFKFEAGTMNYPGAIGLAAALDYVTAIGRENISLREKELLQYATEKMSAIDGLKIYGTSANKIPTISFLLKGIHQYDTGMILDKMGIAVRTGTHCAQPVMDYFGIDGTVRASVCFYNTSEEIDSLVAGIEKVKSMFA
ncbi:MAG: cysteine sulfinate desulfinase [Bacteroidetes bacterium GWE2_41_25]|nr:MAG: cysteine sulfinate desulfinase [Bacteroidetes bacterium GWA2_40_15]OFX85158.1 MAG: cysteine sulfinate desulfinase [Bacteroidetes bacterium GWC2_40_22]OFX96704.1 MAG: cysteine sulfinate desulfinase [Bacteroidetes bacterium GWE2_41_25]OFY60858.1 MAG: cysteine sulfinate desulfinase [Bacteroidetes bacterium GWF2_41_9]HBH83137.1 cysteine desulfurase CsdA [Bacteroidales bacterium]